jgi:hypothetical protein
MVLETFTAVIEASPYVFFLAFAVDFFFASLLGGAGLKGCPQGTATSAPQQGHIFVSGFAMATFLLNYQSTSRLLFPR